MQASRQRIQLRGDALLWPATPSEFCHSIPLCLNLFLPCVCARKFVVCSARGACQNPCGLQHGSTHQYHCVWPHGTGPACPSPVSEFSVFTYRSSLSLVDVSPATMLRFGSPSARNSGGVLSGGNTSSFFQHECMKNLGFACFPVTTK